MKLPQIFFLYLETNMFENVRALLKRLKQHSSNQSQPQPWLVWLSGLSAGLRTERLRWFDSQSGHVPGLPARSPVGGVWEATNRCFSPSLSPFLPLSLKNKFKKSLKKCQLQHNVSFRNIIYKWFSKWCPWPAASASLGNLLEMQIFRPCHRPVESETPER